MVRLASPSARWHEVESVFQHACDLPQPQREEFLRSRCEGDEVLAAEVRSLLEASTRDPGFLDWSVPEQAADRQRHEGDLVGREVGNYRITRFIAAGGMGAVYEAQQRSPRRTVALKFLRASWITPAARRRFDMETEALARMKHPGVAQIYDAGTIADALGPLLYFAMEYVPEARTLIEHARSRTLALPPRVELFAAVCDAVHHGHQRGIIHRDLKPANILVDAHGAPKVIDFGVARLADSELHLTRTTTPVVGTLAYMSPEQLAGDALDLDTRSDVFALGVILYELLCDRLPCETGDQPLSEVMRRIREDVAPAPAAIDARIDRDLQAVMLKALEKDRTLRYQSAAELAEDLRRWLRHEPVNAQPLTATYHLRKWARRHRSMFVGGCIAVLGLAIGLAGAVWQAWRATAAQTLAQQQAQKAQEEASRAENEADAALQLSETLIAFLRSLDPSEADRYYFNHQAGLSPDGLLDFSVGIIERQLAWQPLAQARLFEQMGVLYANRGLHDQSRTLIERALDIRRQKQGDTHVDFATTLIARSWLAIKQDDYALGLSLLQQAYDITLASVGRDDTRTVNVLNQLRNMHLIMGDYAKSEQDARLLLEASARGVRGAERDVALASLAELRRLQGDLDQAAAYFQEVFDLRRQRMGDEDPETGSALYFLAHTQCQRGDLAAINQLLKLAHEQDQRTALLPDNHPYRSGTFLLLGELRMALGELDQAELLLRGCLERRIAGLPKGHRLIAYARGMLGECLLRREKYDEAEPLLKESFEGLRSGYGEHAGWTVDARARLKRWQQAMDQRATTQPQ